MGTLYEINITDGRQEKAQKFGDETNYAEFKTDGELNLAGTAKVKKVIFIGPEQLSGYYTSDTSFQHNGGGDAWSLIDFADNQYYEYKGNFIIPKDYDSGFRARLIFTTGTGVGNVDFTSKFSEGAIGEIGYLTGRTTEYITSGTTWRTASDTTNKKIQTSAWWDIASSATVTAGEYAAITVYRDAQASNTYDILLEVRFLLALKLNMLLINRGGDLVADCNYPDGWEKWSEEKRNDYMKLESVKDVGDGLE